MAKFTKKHYQAIAEVLKIEINKAKNFDKAIKNQGVNSNTIEGIKNVMHSLTDLFKKDNINFKVEKFIDVCIPIEK